MKNDICTKNSQIFTDNQFEAQANAAYDLAEQLKSTYWCLHEAMGKASYPIGACQMEDAQRLGKLAEAIRSLRDAQAFLRHVTCII